MLVSRSIHVSTIYMKRLAPHTLTHSYICGCLLFQTHKITNSKLEEWGQKSCWKRAHRNSNKQDQVIPEVSVKDRDSTNKRKEKGMKQKTGARPGRQGSHLSCTPLTPGTQHGARCAVGV